MEYDVIELKTQKTKYVMQTSKYIFQIYIDCIIHNDRFLKVIFLLCSNNDFLWNLLSAALLRLCWAQLFLSIPPTDVFSSNYFIIQWFLRMESQLNTYEVAN